MDKKKVLIGLISIIILIISIVAASIIQKPKLVDTRYDNIIERMKNKESFNIVFTKSNRSDIRKNIKYYENMYNFKTEYLDFDFNSSKFKEFMKMTSTKIHEDMEIVFLIIEDGKVAQEIIGGYVERNFKESLINFGIINGEYEEIDTPITENLKNHYEKPYSILYIGMGAKDLYKYRETLIKNKIKSAILYIGSANIREVEDLEKELGYGEDIENKFPIVINIKDGNIVNNYTNVKVDELIDKTKINKE